MGIVFSATGNVFNGFTGANLWKQILSTWNSGFGVLSLPNLARYNLISGI